MRQQRGFTLIEILIVMVIIGILATLSIGSFQSSQQKARDSERKSDLQQIANSLEAYYNDYGQYPDSTLDFKLTGCEGGGVCEWGEPFIDPADTVYMAELPEDPKAQNTYYYYSNGSYYQLYARLENTLDAAVPLVGGQPGNYGISCGDENCNYGISSTNRTVTEGRTPQAD